MENPFEKIMEKLETIEHLLNCLKHCNATTHESNEKTSKVLTMKETADYLRISKPTLHKYNTEKRIPFFKVGTRILYRMDELNDWIKNRRVQ